MSPQPSAHNPRRTRAQAARENGRKSRGPVTPEGKFRAATASLKHGLTGKCVVLANECPRKYEALREEYFREWQPQGPTETDLLIHIVNCVWRLRRIWAMETALIDSAMFYKREEFEESYHTPTAPMRAADAFCALNAANRFNFQILHRYETTLTRGYERSLATLRKLRLARGESSNPESVLPHPRSSSAQSANLKTPQPAPPARALPALAHLLNWFRNLIAILLGRIPQSQPRQPLPDDHQPPVEDTAPEISTWQPHESQSLMPREEFLAWASGTFTVPEHLHYESHYTPSENLLIPNSCIRCPACEEREERQRQTATDQTETRPKSRK
jgi:hypothetical protein